MATSIFVAFAAAATPHTWAETPALSPAVATALKGLGADDFTARERAAADLKSALAQEMRALIQTDDPESQARINDLLTFEQGLCEWVKDVLKKPRDQQKGILDFGLQPDVLPHVARLYVPQISARLEAVNALRRNTDPRATDLLAKALADRDQPVYVAAMEALYDRPPTPAVTAALWDRAVAGYFASLRAQPQTEPPRVTFRGKPLAAIYADDNSAYQRTQDNALAAEVLAHIKPPELVSKLHSFLDEVERVYTQKRPDGQDNQNIWMYMPSQEAMRNITRLLTACPAPELLPPLYRIATGPAVQHTPGQFNRESYYWSNRTWAIAVLVQNSGQTPADWNLRPLSQLNGMWVTPSEPDENAAVTKLRQWWSRDHAPSDAATRPAAPAEK